MTGRWGVTGKASAAAVTAARFPHRSGDGRPCGSGTIPRQFAVHPDVELDAHQEPFGVVSGLAVSSGRESRSTRCASRAASSLNSCATLTTEGSRSTQGAYVTKVALKILTSSRKKFDIEHTLPSRQAVLHAVARSVHWCTHEPCSRTGPVARLPVQTRRA